MFKNPTIVTLQTKTHQQAFSILKAIPIEGMKIFLFFFFNADSLCSLKKKSSCLLKNNVLSLFKDSHLFSKGTNV